jgi:hypothetical protein
MGIYVMKAAALKEMLEVAMPEANDFGNEVRGVLANDPDAAAGRSLVSAAAVVRGALVVDLLSLLIRLAGC